MLKRNLPLAMTIVVFIAGYLYCLSQYPGFASTRVIGDLLTDNAFLGIVAVGMTFVIFSGGIDLSVGSTIAFTSVLLAKMIGEYDVPPGLAFVIVLALIMLLAAGVLWRTVHASALRLRDGRQRLFSRSDGRAGEEHDGADLHAIKFSGGVIRYRVFSLYLSRLCSGGQRRGTGYYRGGGHWRYVIDRWRRHPVRRLVWVMIQGLIQKYITFDGTLSSWWTKIVIGILLFGFIGLQKGLNAFWLARRGSGTAVVARPTPMSETAPTDAARREPL